jgi:hypothetical protein
MIEKVEVIDQIEITRDGHVLVRRALLILEDDVEIAKTYHRTSYVPGENVDNEDIRVKDIAGVVWTPAVVDTYNEKVAAEIAKAAAEVEK